MTAGETTLLAEPDAAGAGPKEDRHFVTALARGLSVLACFGPGRTIFGTDAPVSRLVGAFPDLCASLRAAVADLGLDEQRALFFDNARRVYGLGEVSDSVTAGASPAP